MARKYRILKKVLNDRNLGLKKILIVLVMLLAIIAGVLFAAIRNLEEMRRQMQQNLADVAIQNGVILSEKISARYALLYSLSEELDGLTKENVDEKLSHFENFLDDFNLKRFALCFPDGMSYQTDADGTADLSYREFFKAGMEGKSFITGVLTDALTEEHDMVNIMTIPVYDTAGEISCVFGVAYDTEKFNESLSIESFEGKGYSCIINKNGEIMAVSGTESFALAHNIYEVLLEEDSRNEETVTTLKNLVGAKEEGEGVLYLSGKNYYYTVPVDMMNGDVTWNILTIIPASVLTERVVPIQRNQYAIVSWVGALVLAGVGLIIFIIREQNKRLMQFAYEDSITGGSNYTKFCNDMQDKNEKNGYLVAMDITNFNNIAIVAGKAASDTMIRETWNIIRDSIGKNEQACHVREEMFLLYLNAESEDALIDRLEQISGQIGKKAKDFRVSGIHSEYGIYRMDGSETIADAYNKAYIAKKNAFVSEEDNYAFYSEANRVRLQNEKFLEDRFPVALETNEFEAWYQPKYSVNDRKIVGSEALVRWRKADGSLVSPGEFIPLFEKNGMIVQLDEYMFRTVCKQQKAWMEEGKKIYPVSVNVSRASLYRSDIVKRYSKIMDECGIEPQYIQLEVTESIIKGKDDILEIINKFREKGVKILMDDFGTGYSSLATLSTQCFDVLKLDKSLIDHIGTKDGETLLYHVIRMGQQMKLRITAEGVEKEEQVKFLQSVDCDDIQGYYFSRPLPKADFETKL